MSDGIGIISKGLVLKAIEKVTRERRADFLSALNNPSTTPGSDWITFLAQHGGLDPNAEDYFRTAWLATFWSPRYPVEAIVRRGLIEAIELANQQGGSLPIDGYWIWTHDASKFEVLIAPSPQQVTCIFLTPPTNSPPVNPAALTALAPLFAVKQFGTAVPEEQVVRQDQAGQWITVQIRVP